MAWWQRVALPVRRAWGAVSARVRARKHGGGILKLHDDVQTCGYRDVQVMWEMLKRSELELPKQQKRPFWRLPLWSSRSSGDAVHRSTEPLSHAPEVLGST